MEMLPKPFEFIKNNIPTDKFYQKELRLCQTGSLNKHAERPSSRPRTITQLEEAVLQEVEDNSSINTRKLFLQFSISH